MDSYTVMFNNIQIIKGILIFNLAFVFGMITGYLIKRKEKE